MTTVSALRCSEWLEVSAALVTLLYRYRLYGRATRLPVSLVIQFCAYHVRTSFLKLLFVRQVNSSRRLFGVRRDCCWFHDANCAIDISLKVYRNITFGKFHVSALRSSWLRLWSNISFLAVSTDVDVFHCECWRNRHRCCGNKCRIDRILVLPISGACLCCLFIMRVWKSSRWRMVATIYLRQETGCAGWGRWPRFVGGAHGILWHVVGVAPPPAANCCGRRGHWRRHSSHRTAVVLEAHDSANGGRWPV